MSSIMKVGAIHRDPYVTKCAFSRVFIRGKRYWDYCRPGFGIDLLRIVLERELQVVRYSAFGNKGETNGTLVNGIVRGTSDISPFAQYTPARDAVVTFLYPRINYGQRGYLVNPKENGFSNWPMFDPFGQSTWTAGACVYVQKKHSLWKNNSEKLLITLWSAMSKVVTIMYCFYFVRAILPIHPRLVAVQFNNIEKVANKLSAGYKFVVAQNNVFSTQFLANPDPKLRFQFQQSLVGKLFANRNPSIMELVRYTMLHRQTIMADVDVAFLLSYKNMLPNIEDTTLIVRDTRVVMPYFAFMNKNALSANETNAVQGRIEVAHQFGLLERLARSYNIDNNMLNDQLSPGASGRTRKPIHLSLATRFLVIHIAGVAVGSTTLIFECVYFKLYNVRVYHFNN